jgi:hypothetical protein
MPVKDVVIIGVIVIMASIIGIQWEWIALEKMDNRSLSNELYDLQVQSIEEAKRYQEAQVQAQEELNKMQKQVKQVLVANVPKKCTDAMKWAIDQAQTFKDV